MLSVKAPEEVLEIIESSFTFLPHIEKVSINDALGRVLAVRYALQTVRKMLFCFLKVLIMETSVCLQSLQSLMIA